MMVSSIFMLLLIILLLLSLIDRVMFCLGLHLVVQDLKVLAKVLPLLPKWLQKQLVRPHRSMV